MTKLNTKARQIPKVLEQREKITKDHRILLNKMTELTPRDSSKLTIMTREYFPTKEIVAKELKMTPQKVQEQMNEIQNIWKIPLSQPTFDGMISSNQAEVLALTNQHKLRFDKDINDYRVPRVHLYNGELGTGTLYTRNDAFEGERIFRKALGINEMLNDVVFQGGVMPQIMSMYSKLKTERASLTGIDKTKKEINYSKLDELKEYLSLAQRDPITKKKGKLSVSQIKNLETLVVNTIDTMPQAAKSVAHEFKPLIEDIPKEVPIHIFYSYNDDFNMDEIGDLLISSMRLVRSKAKQAESRLPKLALDLRSSKIRLGQTFVNLGVGEYVLKKLDTYDTTIPSGKILREELVTYFSEDKDKQLRKKLFKNYEKYSGNSSEMKFEESYRESLHRYGLSKTITSKDDIIKRIGIDEDKKSKIRETIPAIEEEITEFETYQTAFQAEEAEGHAWFTKKIAMNSTESKAMRMMKKENYKKIYEDHMFTELEKILGYKPNIKLHTDREISVFIPDPSKLYGMNNYHDDKLYGTIFTSVPRVNRQRSNEPTGNTLAQLIKKHEGSTLSRVANNKERPKTIKEFDKHHGMAFSDTTSTSWGVEGFHFMPKFSLAPTRVDGEYRFNTENVNYMKLATRHDVRVLSKLAKKGNRGTWEIKRMEKGGPTTGNTIHIEHPDQSQEVIFLHDNFYEDINKNYGETIRTYEGKLSRARSAKMKRQWKAKINEEFVKVENEFETYNMLLANDVHFGAATERGRPTVMDSLRSSQHAVLQSKGVEGLVGLIGTEWLHGNQAWRSYISSFEGKANDSEIADLKMGILLNQLESYLNKKEVPKGKQMSMMKDYVQEYVSEERLAKPTYIPNEQINIFKRVQKPLMDELLKAGKKVIAGTGNHWKSSEAEIDEAVLLEAMFDLKYTDTKQFEAVHANGGSFTFHPIKLPGRIDAMFTHKMWHGSTEIAQLSKQSIGHKEKATIYLMGDRHHTGMVAEFDKFFAMDAGKQPTMDYVNMIGKASSTRGSTTIGYSPKENKFFGMRFYLDNVVDTLVGWNERAEMLQTSRKLIDEKFQSHYDGLSSQ